jgi:hypothetical protein
MRLRIALLLACACALIAACGALDRTEKVVITATPNAAQLAAAVDATPLLITDSGTYENLTALLDGVCTEFLFSAAGETFVWDTPDALAAFYNRVDESEQCSGEVIRGTFDFDGRVLAGAIAAATGCDASFHVGEVAASGDAHILPLTLTVAPGCAYELVEPLVVAVPRASSAPPLRVEVRGP